ncbi:MAG: RimK/LysX family protein [Betaproteobacteria bacterium]|jgi:hypothetical protein|nr:RimK/LysX family protein [Betaproteobacteria bacterium]
MPRLLRMAGIARILCTLVPMTGFASETVDQKIVVGIVEPIAVGSSGIVVNAKIDTGADSCSLDARNIQTFERDGRKWIRFDVTSRDGRSDPLEAPLVRTVRIRGDDRSLPRRPVVRLPVCLGSVRREVEVNLADRRRYAYPALVGRNFLAGYVLVDSGRERLTHPDCSAAPPR